MPADGSVSLSLWALVYVCLWNESTQSKRFIQWKRIHSLTYAFATLESDSCAALSLDARRGNVLLTWLSLRIAALMCAIHQFTGAAFSRLFWNSLHFPFARIRFVVTFVLILYPICCTTVAWDVWRGSAQMHFLHLKCYFLSSMQRKHSFAWTKRQATNDIL